jgi:hypothetical protein
MGKPRQLCVFRIDYEKIPSMSSWTAFIAAYSHEEAVAYLLRKVGPHRATTSGLYCRVDAFDDTVLKDIYNAVKSRVDVKAPAAEEKVGTELRPSEFEEPRPLAIEVPKKPLKRK